MAATIENGTLPTERYVRLPGKGYCPSCGLSRSHLYRLIAKGVIKSANVRQPGQLRGIRLVWLPSVLSYLERFAEGPADLGPTPPGKAREVAK